MNELSERDQELSRRLAASLERGAQQPDAALDAALLAARRRAQDGQGTRQQKLRPWLWASGMALAAGVAMFVVLPAGSPQTPRPATVQATSKAVDDPEMLDDMDMLQALAAQPTRPDRG